MNPDPYRRHGGDPPAPDPAARPARPPSADYGVRPEAPGLRREPWMTDDDMATLPSRRRGQTYADWLAERARWIEGLRQTRAAGAPEPPATAIEPATAAESPAPSPPPADGPPPPVAKPAPTAAAKPAAAEAPAAARPGPAFEKPLRPRQERFCQLFVVLGNASDAAWQAGYSFPERRNQGYRLLRRPAIQARIAALQRDLARTLNMDAEVMLGKLESVYRRAVEGEYLNAAARVVEVQARIAGHMKSRAAPPRLGKDDK